MQRRRRRRRIGEGRNVWFMNIRIFLGLSTLILAVVTTIFESQIHDTVSNFTMQHSTLDSNSVMTGYWTNPPIDSKLVVYLFNVTNHESFLNGTDSKLKVEEVGPFVYETRIVKRVLDRPTNDTVRFESRSQYKFRPEESFEGAENRPLILPNVLLLSGMLKREVRSQSDFIKRNLVWPILTSAGERMPTPFISKTADEYLWGYEDELACLENEDDDEFSEWFDEVEKEKKSGYRDTKTGKCIFGVLSKKNGTWDNPVTIRTGSSNLKLKGRIVLDNEKSNDKRTDPSALPAPSMISGDMINIWVGAICRTLTLKRKQTKQRYSSVVETETFSIDAETSLYQNAFPYGGVSLESCYDGVPFIATFPHFLYGDPWYLDQVEGVDEPNRQLHEVYYELERKLGTPVSVQIRFQLNILISRDTSFEPLSHLAVNETVLPIFWVQEGYSSLDPYELISLEFALLLPSLVSKGIIAIFIVSGTLILASVIIKLYSNKDVYSLVPNL